MIRKRRALGPDPRLKTGFSQRPCANQGEDYRMQIDPRDRLIVALDVSTVEEARAMVALIGAGKKLFIDMKLHDISNTVAAGVRSASRVGATFLTVHAYPETMKAAA